MIQIIKGDLLASDERFIAHGCNTMGAMHAGIADQIRKKYPLVFHAYKRELSGRFVPGYAQMVAVGPERTVFNLATQDYTGPHARLEWVYLAFRNMAEICAVYNIQRVAIPEIGCGLGGLSWSDVEMSILSATAFSVTRGNNLEIVCYVYKPPRAPR